MASRGAAWHLETRRRSLSIGWPSHGVDLSFKDMQPVCTELPVRTRGQPDRAGYIDNLLINRDGKICLVECKLWRNAEAAREVVAQLLDYAAGLSTWSYQELREAVAKRSPRGGEDPIAARVLGPEAGEDEREELAKAIERSLKRGNFLLLIAGDGIRPEVQEMARLLQGQPMLSFVLALVEVIREMPGNDPARAIGESEFYQQFGTAGRIPPARLKAFLQRCEAMGCRLELRRRYILYVDVPGKRPINAGTIGKTGTVEFWGQASRDIQIGEPIGRSYMERVVRLISGASLKDESPEPMNWHIRCQDRSDVPLGLLLEREGEWLSAIQDLITGLRAAGAG